MCKMLVAKRILNLFVSIICHRKRNMYLFSLLQFINCSFSHWYMTSSERLVMVLYCESAVFVLKVM